MYGLNATHNLKLAVIFTHITIFKQIVGNGGDSVAKPQIVTFGQAARPTESANAVVLLIAVGHIRGVKLDLAQLRTLSKRLGSYLGHALRHNNTCYVGCGERHVTDLLQLRGQDERTFQRLVVELACANLITHSPFLKREGLDVGVFVEHFLVHLLHLAANGEIHTTGILAQAGEHIGRSTAPLNGKYGRTEIEIVDIRTFIKSITANLIYRRGNVDGRKQRVARKSRIADLGDCGRKDKAARQLCSSERYIADGGALASLFKGKAGGIALAKEIGRHTLHLLAYDNLQPIGCTDVVKHRIAVVAVRVCGNMPFETL